MKSGEQYANWCWYYHPRQKSLARAICDMQVVRDVPVRQWPVVKWYFMPPKPNNFDPLLRRGWVGWKWTVP